MNTGKIIKITEDTIFIGYEDGSIKEIQRSSVDFEPSVGDLVELYGEIAIKANGKKNKAPTSNFNFKHLSFPSKINIVIASLLIILSICLPLLLPTDKYLDNFLASLFLSSIILSLLNIVLLIIQIITKEHSHRKISTIYLLSSLSAIFLILAISVIKQSITNSNVTTSMEIKDNKTKSSNKLYKLLEKNKGQSFSITAEASAPLLSFETLQIKNITNIKVNGIDYGIKYMAETLDIDVLENDDETLPFGYQEVTIEGRIIEKSGSIVLEIFDIFTPDKTLDGYVSERTTDGFETLGIVTEIKDTNTFLGSIVKIKPTWLDIRDDGKNSFYFKNGEELKVLVTRDTEEYLLKHYRKLEVGDEVTLYGSIVTADGVNVFSANDSASIHGVERKD